MIDSISTAIVSMASSVFGFTCVVLWALGVLHLWDATGLMMTYVLLVFPPWPFVAGVGVIARMFGVPV